MVTHVTAAAYEITKYFKNSLGINTNILLTKIPKIPFPITDIAIHYRIS